MIAARDNPFRTDRVLLQRYRMDDRGWRDLIDRLDTNHGKGCIHGAHGSGKTTLLEDLALKLQERGGSVIWLRFSEEERPRISGMIRALSFVPSKRAHVLVDGAEQLSFIQWMWLQWRCRPWGGLVITSHTPGRLPLLHSCVTSAALLEELVQALGITLTSAEATDLFLECEGNIREALRTLYDQFAEAQ